MSHPPWWKKLIGFLSIFKWLHSFWKHLNANPLKVKNLVLSTRVALGKKS